MKNFIQKYYRGLAVGALFVLNYVPTFLWMWERWFVRDSYYSHGVIIPFVSLFLIWQMRAGLKPLQQKESVWGLRLIVIGITVHLISSLLRVYFSSGFSMIIVLVGIIIYFFGEEVFKKIAFPLAFLIFMIPLPMVVIANISFKLKLFAAEIATVLLNNMRIPAINEGSIIKMRSAYVVVDDVCSGLRSLISLTALGSIFAFWMKGPLFKRLLLFLSTIPIAIITNVCRIVFLAMVSEIWGPQYATGFLHDLSGFMIFVLAFILLYMVGKLIE